MRVKYEWVIEWYNAGGVITAKGSNPSLEDLSHWAPYHDEAALPVRPARDQKWFLERVVDNTVTHRAEGWPGAVFPDHMLKLNDKGLFEEVDESGAAQVPENYRREWSSYWR